MVYAVGNGSLLVSLSAGLAASGCLATGKEQGVFLYQGTLRNCHGIVTKLPEVPQEKGARR